MKANNIKLTEEIYHQFKTGESTYKKLSDIYPNIRQVNNIEKMYLSNLFDEEISS